MRPLLLLAIGVGAIAGVMSTCALIAYRVGDEPLLEVCSYCVLLCILLGGYIEHLDDREDDWW